MTSEEYRQIRQRGRNLYQQAKSNGITNKRRWEEGIDHHHKSVELMTFIEEHDLYDYSDSFGWKVGGDGDNGESLMYEMDAYFEQKDLNKDEN